MPNISFDVVSFDDMVKKMPEYLEELKACKPFIPDKRGNLRRDDEPLKPLPKVKGVYCFYEGDESLYVGRTNNINSRVPEHRRPSGDHYTASFAFNIAKAEFKKEHPRRNVDNLTRKKLERDSDFAPLFTKSKARVREMSVRFVEIQDPIEQTIFEVYAHMKLGTPTLFNNFGNH